MANYQVRCINKDDRYNPFERILEIGIETTQGVIKYPQPEIIHFIETMGHTFYVEAKGQRAYLQVAESPHGNKYVKTENDNLEPNNLLNLLECV